MNVSPSRLRRLILACACLTITGSVSAAQGPAKPKPSRNLADMLGTGGGWEDPAPARTPSNGASNASVESTPPSAVQREILTLEKRIATGKRIALELERDASAVPPVGNLAKMLAMAADYRQRYELMRERLYVSEPVAGSSVADSVAAFMGRWGTIGTSLQAGTRSSASLTSEQRETAATRLGTSKCPLGSTTLEPTVNGVPGGRAWACLTDAYFGDLARQEAAVNDALFASRDRALADLAIALAELEAWKRRQEPPRSAADTLRLERDFSVRLHRIYLAGIAARHAELIRIRDARKESVFQQFLAQATKATNSIEGNGTGLLVGEGRQLRATLGSTRTTVLVVAPSAADDDADLARRLRAVHYRLATLEAEVSASDREKLRDAAVQLAADLATDPMVENPRALPAFRTGMQEKEAALLADRPARVSKLRLGLEAQRAMLVERIAHR